MALNPEKVEAAISFVARLLISLVLPAWALVMLALGLRWGSWWWIGCGVAVGAIGAVLLVANPLIWPLVRDAE